GPHLRRLDPHGPGRFRDRHDHSARPRRGRSVVSSPGRLLTRAGFGRSLQGVYEAGRGGRGVRVPSRSIRPTLSFVACKVPRNLPRSAVNCVRSWALSALSGSTSASAFFFASVSVSCSASRCLLVASALLTASVIVST